MTWKTARRALTTRWWFLVLCALLAGAAAAFVVHRTPRNYTISMTIRDVPGLGIGAAPAANGNAVVNTLTLQPVPQKTGWTPENWWTDASPTTKAEKAVAKAQKRANLAILNNAIASSGLNVTPAKFLQNLKLPAGQQENPKALKVTGLKPSLLTFTYPTSGNAKATATLVQTYITNTLNQRLTQLQKAIPAAIAGFKQDQKTTLTGDSTANTAAPKGNKGTAGQHEYQHDQAAIDALQAMQGANGLATMIHPVGTGATILVTKKPMRAEYAGIGGAIIGLLAGALILLAIRWGRGRISDETELLPLEKPIITVDSRTGEGFDTLRAELEVAGIGAATAVVAVGTAQNGDGRSDLALELARTFARAGISTAFVSANPLAPGEMAGNGTAAFLSGTEAVLETIPVQPDLVWVPYGDEPVDGVTVTAENAQALVSAVRLFARAIVIEIAPVESDPSARLFAHCADALVLQVNRNRSRGARVYNAALTLHRASRAPLVVCFETGPLGRRNSATEPERIMAPPARMTAGAPSGS
jgi:Mrp family chromosome partitioning ATPase